MSYEQGEVKEWGKRGSRTLVCPPSKPREKLEFKADLCMSQMPGIQGISELSVCKQSHVPLGNLTAHQKKLLHACKQ